jgi:hypothetical protein
MVNEEQLLQLIAYERSLADQAPTRPPAGAAPPQAPGKD